MERNRSRSREKTDSRNWGGDEMMAAEDEDEDDSENDIDYS